MALWQQQYNADIYLAHTLWFATDSGNWQDKHYFPTDFPEAVEENDETNETARAVHEHLRKVAKRKEEEEKTSILYQIYFHSSGKIYIQVPLTNDTAVIQRIS